MIMNEIIKDISEEQWSRGAWVAQSGPTRDFSPDHDLKVVRSIPTLDSMLCVEPA